MNIDEFEKALNLQGEIAELKTLTSHFDFVYKQLQARPQNYSAKITVRELNGRDMLDYTPNMEDFISYLSREIHSLKTRLSICENEFRAL